MKLRHLLAGAALTAGLIGASAASAAVYDIVGDFGSSVFQYGRGGPGAGFLVYPSHSACNTGLDCYYDPSDPSVVLKNVGSSDFVYSTVDFPAGEVNVHPSNTGAAAIIRFVAPTAGTYTISGAFARFDVTANGDGTQDGVYATVSGVTTQLYQTLLAPTSYGSSTPFTGLTAVLGVGDTVDFTVGQYGSYQYDSTGVSGSLSVSGTPEPAAWALMIGGFGLAGAMLRRRRTAVA